MTATGIWNRLTAAFPPEDIKRQPGSARYGHACPGHACRETRNPACHTQLRHPSSCSIMDRLDAVLTPAGWNFVVAPVPGTAAALCTLALIVDGVSSVRSDFGYPPSTASHQSLKEATTDGIERCAMLFGIGRGVVTGEEAPVHVDVASPERVAVLLELSNKLGATAAQLDHMAGGPIAEAADFTVETLIARAETRAAHIDLIAQTPFTPAPAAAVEEPHLPAAHDPDDLADRFGEEAAA